MPPVIPALDPPGVLYADHYRNARIMFRRDWEYEGYMNALAKLVANFERMETGPYRVLDPAWLSECLIRAKALRSLYQRRVAEMDKYCPPADIPF
jgi:hypothetical protein